MSVDAAVVRWLKEGAIYELASDASTVTKYGAVARETSVMSPLALTAGAAAEAARQVAFLSGPLVVDTHLVKGLRSDLIGQPVTITTARLGYDAGLVVFVIGVAERDETDQTVLTVLRKLT
jgi:DNA-binding transcriptional regulator LsrR (DeoR family)